ncbi:alpha/beta fold hydrolase [Williamsia deligens]|uniref:Alpha/beta fold hydrolase n=1 Tax=Williamsia deligens TaxID=321325 RepID=A0ABW3G6W7_9NOCA|nr:alpha/beta hydrolase [Williamsia deligens]MCP2193287.1 Pimeloyl-ACP methyl ester carboxylesterase [Williamsia deligens]
MPPPDPSTVRFEGPWTHLDVRANGIRFHAVECGPPRLDRPLVLLLHGFGEFWWSWRHQLADLDAAGYRAVAVDLRGYGDTDKPPRGYDGWTLAGDTNALIRSLGHTHASLVGHADGGLVCWATATLHPRAVDSIATVASPHPRALRRAVIRDRAQRSAFLGDFLGNQLPRRAEKTLTRDDGAFIARMFVERAGAAWRRTEDFATTVGHNRSAIQIPGAAHCSLEYRRWAFRSQFRRDGATFLHLMNRRLTVPVLEMRGQDDHYIGADTVAAGRYYATRFAYAEIPDAAHFAHQENPTRSTELLTEHLAGVDR